MRPFLLFFTCTLTLNLIFASNLTVQSKRLEEELEIRDEEVYKAKMKTRLLNGITDNNTKALLVEASVSKLELLEEINGKLCQKYLPIKEFTRHYHFDENQLRRIKDFGRNTLEIFFKSINYNELYKEGEGDLGIHIKERLYPGCDSNLPMSKYWHEKIFMGLKLDSIFHILGQDPNSQKENVGVLKVIQKESIKKKLDRLIMSWYNQFEPYTQSLLFDSENEELVDSYEGGEETLINHIKSQLYMNNFFPLEHTPIKPSNEMQYSVFKLLSLDDIFFILEKGNTYWRQNHDIKEFLKQPNLVDELRAVIMTKYLGALIRILAQMPELEALPEIVEDEIARNYQNLCSSTIPKAIIYAELKKATNDFQDLSMVCPDDEFFPLKDTGIKKVDDLLQKNVFKLLWPKEIVLALFNHGYLLQNDYKIKDFIIQNPKCLDALRFVIIMFRMKELSRELIKIPELQNHKYKLNQSHLDYEALRKEVKYLVEN